MNKQIKILMLFLCTFLFINDATAQIGYEDVVYLKNGSVIHGIIIEQIPNESVKIQTKDKSMFVFKMEEIDKIAKEKKPGHAGRGRGERQAKPAVADTEPYTGYSLSIESHIGEGISDRNNQESTFATHVINGIMVNGVFSVGAGVGLDLLNENKNYINNNNSHLHNNDYNPQFLLFAYYIDVRAFPLHKSKISPLIILNYGYSADMFSSVTSGGTLLNAGIGAKLKFSRRMGLNLSLNYKRQNLRFDDNRYYNNQIQEPYRYSLEYICLTLGVTL